ncbi:MAG: beta-ketoacyl-ACP synthase III [Clostridia bacterium]|nr:beta-ketoacyl-ACP synthase III [Clostridia bacterium]
MNFKVLGTGSYIPPRVVTNDELATMMDTSDEAVMKLVGIKERHVSVNETTSQMGVNAAKAALENSGVKAEDLDLILCVTMTAEYANPGIGALIQRDIGAKCPAMDIGGVACTGFVYLLETAASFIATGKYKKVLLVASERLSDVTDWSDRNTAIIFSDGAGAMVVSDEEDNLLSSKVNTFGDDEVIVVPNKSGKSPFWEGKVEENGFIFMNGKKTYRFAIAQMSDTINEMMAECNLKDEDIKWVVPHQANIRIINEAMRKVDISDEKFKTSIERYGNNSSACIPILIDEMNRNGELERGDKIVLVAFGGGLHSGGAILRW